MLKFIPDLFSPVFRFAYRSFMILRGFVADGEIFAAQLVVLKDNEVLLIRPTYRPHWEFPGGKIDPGETAEEAASREAFEEASIITIGGLREVFVLKKKEYGTQVTIHLFLANEWSDAGSWKPNLEIGDRKFFPIDSLPSNISVFVRHTLENVLKETDILSDISS